MLVPDPCSTTVTVTSFPDIVIISTENGSDIQSSSTAIGKVTSKPSCVFTVTVPSVGASTFTCAYPYESVIPVRAFPLPSTMVTVAPATGALYLITLIIVDLISSAISPGVALPFPSTATATLAPLSPVASAFTTG